MKLTVTPADYTTVTWFVDGEEVATRTAKEKEFMELIEKTRNLI